MACALTCGHPPRHADLAKPSSQKSGNVFAARFVGLLFNDQISDPKKFMISCATSWGRVMVGT